MWSTFTPVLNKVPRQISQRCCYRNGFTFHSVTEIFDDDDDYDYDCGDDNMIEVKVNLYFITATSMCLKYI
jgi:hypothetical protein